MNNSTTKVLLIDLENCPSSIHQLMNHLGEYLHIVVCYAQSGAKIPIDWIMPLTTTVNEGRLKLVKMPEIGKNAADFGIAFWAGVLMTQLPENTHFDIVSNDTDLDYVLSLLTSQNRSAERRGIKKESQSVSQVTVSQPVEINIDKLLLRYVIDYCTHLEKHQFNPAKKKTLLNSIKSKFKAAAIDVDENKIFESLLANSVISLKGEEVIYNQQKINKFATVT